MIPEKNICSHWFKHANGLVKHHHFALDFEYWKFASNKTYTKRKLTIWGIMLPFYFSTILRHYPHPMCLFDFNCTLLFLFGWLKLVGTMQFVTILWGLIYKLGLVQKILICCNLNMMLRIYMYEMFLWWNTWISKCTK